MEISGRPLVDGLKSFDFSALTSLRLFIGIRIQPIIFNKIVAIFEVAVRAIMKLVFTPIVLALYAAQVILKAAIKLFEKLSKALKAARKAVNDTRDKLLKKVEKLKSTVRRCRLTHPIRLTLG